MFKAVHIVEELAGGGGTRIGKALIFINVLFLLQRTQKPESVEKIVSVNIWGTYKLISLKFFS